MQLKLWIIIMTGLLIYDTYHEHYYFNLLKTYKKYYKMIGIGLFGLGLFIMTKKGDNMQSVSILNNFVKVLPIDRDSKDMITPFISQNKIIERIQTSGCKSKRSVSETKKNMWLQCKIGNAANVKNNYRRGLK